MHYCLINLIKSQNLTTVYICLNLLEYLILKYCRQSLWVNKASFYRKPWALKHYFTKQKNFAFISLLSLIFLMVFNCLYFEGNFWINQCFRTACIIYFEFGNKVHPWHWNALYACMLYILNWKSYFKVSNYYSSALITNV